MSSLLVRGAIAVIIVLALLARPGLLPFALAGALVVLVVWLWLSGRRKLVAAIGAAVAIVLVFAVLVGGGETPQVVEIRGAHVVPGLYVGHLVLTGSRELQVVETLDIFRTPRRGLRAALSNARWDRVRLRNGTRRYRRSGARPINVPSVFPQERTHYFVPSLGGRPSSLDTKAPSVQRHEVAPVAAGFSVDLNPESRVVLDAPSNAIGETVPDAEREPGAGSGSRVTLALPQFGEPVEFAVRSPLFRRQPFAAVADATPSFAFGLLLVLAMTTLVNPVRDFLWGWPTRAIKRSPRNSEGGNRRHDS